MLADTDYLVVGAGASGLAFADALAAEADVEVTVIDRRGAPGGHWADAYPFVRLHTPSAYYGMNSLALGGDRIDQVGENAGFYERASGDEVSEYFAEAAGPLTKTGRVRLLTRHEHLGAGSDGEQVRDLGTGELHDVAVRRKVVDARYLEASVPATHTTPFQVAPGVRLVSVNDLPAAAQSDCSYAVLGSGKTAADACMWLLDNDVQPDRIRWIRPRDAWFYDRRHFQPLEQVDAIMEGNSLDAEAGADAANVDDLFERLEESGRLARIDPAWPATMYRGTMLSACELAALRQIEDVVRLGWVQRIEADRIVLERGETKTGPHVLHVDCTALGLNNAPATPIFGPDRIVLQQVRHLSLQGSSHRLRRGPPRRRPGQEPALPTQPLPQQHRGLTTHDEPHMENGGAVVERARPLIVGGQEPAQPAGCASRPRGGAVRAKGSQAISHTRPRGDPAAEAAGRIDST